ncbi:hypothetical protein KDAU_59370 [Dictyobacter aurantiacus]|uniref:Uncharacterized protein n=1 Tax=Dictyobacter aurantiacus TaxID=1936993 RepID=A0A401ZNX2_9CHLR|nr:hypothetical protein KDAU_59370 [Dictyobacter aurantiacus]
MYARKTSQGKSGTYGFTRTKQAALEAMPLVLCVNVDIYLGMTLASSDPAGEESSSA